jgi:hypothetical protein
VVAVMAVMLVMMMMVCGRERYGLSQGSFPFNFGGDTPNLGLLPISHEKAEFQGGSR